MITLRMSLLAITLLLIFSWTIVTQLHVSVLRLEWANDTLKINEDTNRAYWRACIHFPQLKICNYRKQHWIVLWRGSYEFIA